MNASELIDKRIAELSDWRGQRIAHIRQLVREAAPDIVEEWKWDTPVWSHNGNVLAVGAFQNLVKINFFHGALLYDRHLFNAGLEAKTTRAIDIFENDTIDEAALKELVRAAVELNNPKPTAAKKATRAASKSKSKKTAGKQAASPSTRKQSDLPKLSVPAHRALAGAGVKNLKQLSRF
ncbi:MAG TPA: DUF1801 domain-containing protein, partial [Anaerolineales bacterium]|nr:DUF1801 domain-containing protein [Anaerolineales bacterium]